MVQLFPRLKINKKWSCFVYITLNWCRLHVLIIFQYLVMWVKHDSFLSILILEKIVPLFSKFQGVTYSISNFRGIICPKNKFHGCKMYFLQKWIWSLLSIKISLIFYQLSVAIIESKWFITTVKMNSTSI